MKSRIKFAVAIILFLGLLLGVCSLLATQAQPAVPNSTQKAAIMNNHAKGTFEVRLAPLATESDPALGRMSIDKQLHGDLEGSTKGEMLSFMSGVKGSAGYVAMEKVTATLVERKGTFVLQHSATMTRGVPALSVTVVPDSGTDELVGLTGKFDIIITDGKHSYDFEYSLPESH